MANTGNVDALVPSEAQGVVHIDHQFLAPTNLTAAPRERPRRFFRVRTIATRTPSFVVKEGFDNVPTRPVARPRSTYLRPYRVLQLPPIGALAVTIVDISKYDPVGFAVANARH
ncbi:MAG TPA: hypothetical protein VGX91_00915 [Candidatus Cybelea sp.]|jgi:hypothetical protein|nr:hypothetical protein [Candidatus Cybelea sp.]